MDLKRLSEKNRLAQRSMILRDSLNHICEATIDFIANGYEKRDLLNLCLDFIVWDLIDTSRSDFDSLKKVWLFPVQEAEAEFGEALNNILFASYKSVYDHLRRALELMVVGQYFLLENIDAKTARQWIKSEKETPPISRAIKSLLENKRFNESDKHILWSTNIKNFYWHLCDIIHVRGSSFSLKTLQPFSASINGINVPKFSKKSLIQVLDDFIETIQHAVTIVSLGNPILLVGLPLYEKFGINTPLSGFFEEHQSETLWHLMSEDVKPYFKKFAENDQEIKSILEWIESMPDISKEELEKQLRDWRNDFPQISGLPSSDIS